MALGDSPGGKEVGRLSLKVLPDTTGFAKKLQTFADAVEKTVRIEIPVSLDLDDVVDDVMRLKAMVEGLDPDIDVDTHVSPEAIVELEKLTAALEAISANDVEIDTELLSGEALIEMNRLLTELKFLSAARQPVIRPDVDGTLARTKMMMLMAQLGAMKMALGGVSSTGGEVGKNVALWGPLIFMAAAGIAAVGPALAALIPLALGFAGGIGVILLSLDQLKETFGPLWDEMKGMGDKVGPALVAGLEPFVKLMTTKFIPVLEDGLTVLAKVMNSGLKSMLGFLTSAEGLSVMGTFFEALAPALQPFADLMGPLLEAILRLSIAASPALQMMGEAILGAVEGFNEWIQGADAAATISESMSLLGDILVVAGQLIAQLFPPLMAAAPAVISLLQGAVQVFGALFAALQPVFEWMQKNSTMMQIIGAVLLGVIVAVALVAAAIAVISVVFASTATIVGAVIGAIVGFLIYAWMNFEGFRNAVTTILTALQPVFSFLWTFIKFVFGNIVAALKVLWAVFKVWFAWMKVIYAPIIAGLKLWWAAVKQVFAFIAPILTNAMQAWARFRDQVVERVTSLLSAVQKIPERVKNALAGLPSLLVASGRALIQGLIDGINSMIDRVSAPMKSIAGKIKSFLPGSPVKDGPLTSWNNGGAGVRLMGLLAAGISAGGGQVLGEIESVMNQAAAITDSYDLTPTLAGLTGFPGGSVDVSASKDPVRFQFEDWNSGKGLMRQEAENVFAGYAAIETTAALMGGN